MANTKQVHMDAWLPFDWASNLTGEEAQCWMAFTQGVSGLKLMTHRGRSDQYYEELPEGGRRCMIHVSCKGREAMRDGSLAVLADSWRKQRYSEVVAETRDVDNDTEWYTIPTKDEADASKERAKVWAEQLMEGKRWISREVAEGIGESKLWPEDEPAPEGWS